MARTKKDSAQSAEPGKVVITPLMAQYFSVKSQYPDAVLLFRVGDFYETFGEDAIRASQALGITLTSRNNGGSDIELAGFPFHAMDMYLPRLVRAGYRVAICEQMEKPVPGRVVRRSVTEVVTPGVTTDDALLSHHTNNYLCTVAYGRQDHFGIAFLDISTGEFFATEGGSAHVDKLLQSFQPAEVVMPKSRHKEFAAAFGDRWYINTLEDWIFTKDFGREKLLRHFQVSTLKGFGLEELPLSQAASGAALQYLLSTENNKLAHITRIGRLHTEQYVWLDRFTIRNLELVHPNHENGRSLLLVLDHTLSPMGARLLKKWVLLPLTNLNAIRERHLLVGHLKDRSDLSTQMQVPIRQIGDLERLMSKTATGKINPREVQQLKRSLQAIDQLQQMLCQPDKPPRASGGAEDALFRIGESLHPCASLRQRIERELAEDPPADLRKGSVMADGADAVLDELRHLIRNSKSLLLALQQRESERTGIPALKIGFNNVFGYYLEVTNKYKDLVPTDWIRKQTVANGERLITQELKVLESDILGAEDKIAERESTLFKSLVDAIGEYIQPLQHNAQLVARLDCLLSMARAAEKMGYVCPEMDDSLAIDIREGRHPVIETQLPVGEPYIPNDILLDNNGPQIALITGPNMAGKSALLRQTALIVLMGQMGSFVPAHSARMGLIDKVFTRVGASDNISGGESTFMVEMNETALILNNLSERSLILLDEIGRGTSTYDGLSIAWSITEYLHNNDRARPKTLFATHYHELSALADQHERIQNMHVSTRQSGQKVLFLRKLQPGSSNHSFGIHVAQMAGVPPAVVSRAREILGQLEQQHLADPAAPNSGVPQTGDTKAYARNLKAPMQLQIFETDPYTVQIREQLLALNLDTMTPIDAMWKLHELRRIAEKK
jgi:DNA mismatch repair protein MutS